jgi:DNA-binding PadR family transcriptional regulator
MDPLIDDYIPLAPATLHILLSLAGEEMYGYAIMQEVARQSKGRYRLGPGTLYDNLQRLMKQGLVEEAANRSNEEASRRKYYRLSGFGRRVLSAEVDRLEEILGQARPQLEVHT